MNYEALLEKALTSGAEEAEVYVSKSNSHPVSFEANRLKQLESSESEGIALRVWRNGCPGLAVAYGEVEPEALVEKALSLSVLNPPETPELTASRPTDYPNLGKPVPVNTLVEMGKEAIAQIRDANPDVLCSAGFDCEEETTIFLNTKGLSCQYSDTSLSGYLGVEWIRGEDFLGIYDGQVTRDELDTASIIEAIIQRLNWAKKNASPPLGRVPVLFTPKAATMLWGTVAAAMNGKRVLEKSSPWSSRQGERVVSEMLTLSQQPDQGPYSCPFDDEGTPTQTLSLIQQGQLEQFYRDRAVGRALGLETSGNGFRPGLNRYPSPDLVNLVIEPGTASLQELISQLDKALIVDQMLGGGADISGDFSVNVELGYCVQNGEIVGRVKDTMVAGNVYTALRDAIALGSDREWNDSCYTPSIVVDSLSVVGG